MNHSDKIILGTAQFGMDYGITNSTGKISSAEVCKILEYAFKNGVTTLDTAEVYGNSEKVIGESTEKCSLKFDIISKFNDCKTGEVRQKLNSSLKKLQVDALYGYLIHNFDNYISNPEIINELQELKQEDKIKKIGFSLYFPWQLEKLFEDGVDFDLVQFPYNVLDQRFNKYFSILKEKSIEINTRSVFLQGILLTDPKRLKNGFAPIKDKIIKLYSVAEKNSVTPALLCINYAIRNQYIDRIIIGIDNLDHLRNNLKLVEQNLLWSEINQILDELEETDENMIIPMNWKQK